MFPFQIRSGPQFRDFSSKMLPFQIRYGPLEKGTRTILKPAFWHFRVTFPPRFEGRRVGSVGRRFAFSYSFSTTRPRFARAKTTDEVLLLIPAVAPRYTAGCGRWKFGRRSNAADPTLTPRHERCCVSLQELVHPWPPRRWHRQRFLSRRGVRDVVLRFTPQCSFHAIHC